MKRWLLIALPILLTGCPDQPEDSEDYKKGYEAGHEAGYDEGADSERAAMCQQIENYKESIHEALKEANICP